MTPTRKDAYKLIHEGVLALAEVESNGMAVDVPYYEEQAGELGGRVGRLEKRILKTEEAKKWKARYRHKFNLDSGLQLGDMLFNHLGHKAEVFTAKTKNLEKSKRRPSTKEEDLAKVDSPMVRMWVKKNQLHRLKVKIEGVLKECVDGILRPFYNLHIPQSYRSSSDSPNGQNWYKRDPELAKIMRMGVTCRPGNQLTEFDFKGNEIKSATCYHHDPVMIEYLEDPSKDMHRDAAMDCYVLPLEEMTKEIRYCGKNKFIFPQFFGDYYIACAKNMWEACRTMKLRTKVSKIPLRQHLKAEGIKTLMKFTDHIKKVEREFWHEKFKVYDQWKDDFWEEYCSKGWLDMLTGFRCHELLTKNECINRPIQGTAFHWLLWSLIELQKEIRKRKMKALIVGQIHDSIKTDHPPEEADELAGLVKEICEERIREYWSWIIVPMSVEVERSEVDGNWWDMKEVEE